MVADEEPNPNTGLINLSLLSLMILKTPTQAGFSDTDYKKSKDDPFGKVLFSARSHFKIEPRSLSFPTETERY